MSHRLAIAAALAGLVAGIVTSAPAASPTLSGPVLTTLQPGGFRVIEHPLDVNVVFVGLGPGTGLRQVDVARFLAALPREARPRVRIPGFYGIKRDLGLHFTYRYHVAFASPAFDDAFFSFLATHGTEGPPTLFQRLYNEQRAATRHIDSNLMIDAVDTERWLGEHSASIGVDTTKYTVFFVNWFGRPDFRDHLYNKPGDADPDTGFTDALTDFGPGDAWGGTPADDPERPLGSLRRIWFYDASAAVDFGDGSWNVDDPGGNPSAYRMPPIWEYGNRNGYRAFDDLTGDLAKLARYVAIDMLFTPSPLYDPAISGPKLPSKIQIDLTGLDGRPGSHATDLVQGPIVASKVAATEPYNQFSYEQHGRPLAGRELEVYKCFQSAFTSDPNSCYGNRLYPYGLADLFLWIGDHLFTQFIEGEPDYEIPVAFYDIPDELAPGFLGYADDNWTNGIQSYIYAFPLLPDVPRENPIDFSLPANLSFTPTDASHFAVAFAPADFDPAVGANLGLGDDDSTEVSLPFAFPFLGGTYTSIHVNSDGNITLGARDSASAPRTAARLIAGPPRIAPLYRDLDPSTAGSVSASVRSGTVVVTWSGVPAYGLPSSNTFQVTLAASGQITFAYKRLWPFGFVGLAEGNRQGPINRVDLSKELPGTFEAGAIYEPFLNGRLPGGTSTVIHEVGHHLGLSHPHDGFDWETGVDFVQVGAFEFANEGDYSDTKMSYLNQQLDFSQFDRDALDRDMTSIYLNEANAILGKIYASGKADLAADLILSADGKAADALQKLTDMEYRAAAVAAKAAYVDVLAAAAKVGVPVEPESIRADYNAQGHSFKFKDPLTDPRAEGVAVRGG